jgi:hypothetical protein
MPSMTGLPTTFLAAFMPQTFGLLREAIAGRRLVAIVAIFRQAVFQGLDPIDQIDDHLDQVIHQRNHSFLALKSSAANFLFAGNMDGILKPYFGTLRTF